MTFILAVDPGRNSGIAYGFYDAVTPFQLIDRWQVYNGLDGFLDWWAADAPDEIDECVVEKFLSVHNEYAPDISGVPIEGVIALAARHESFPIIWQTRMDKSSLVGYPESAKTKAQRQRIRFDFLKEHGLFIPGTDNDDSHDAITHILVSLKKRRHIPTMKLMWPPKDR